MFFNYFSEIKNRTFLIIILWVSVTLTSYFYKETLLFLLIKPYLKFLSNGSFYFISTDLTEIFSVYIRVSYFVANQLCIFSCFYQTLIFLTPGLYEQEYKKLRNIIIIGTFFWGLSFIMLNFFLLPNMCQFFLSFQHTTDNQAVSLYFEAKIMEYLDFYILLYYICSVNSQLFLIVFILLESLADKIRFIRKSRKVIYLMFLILATFITPPDIISQILIGSCFICAYEVIILVILSKAHLLKSLIR